MCSQTEDDNCLHRRWIRTISQVRIVGNSQAGYHRTMKDRPRAQGHQMDDFQQRALQDFRHNQCMWLARLSLAEHAPTGPHDRMTEAHGGLAVRIEKSGIITLPYPTTTDQAIAAAETLTAWAKDGGSRELLIWNMDQNPDLDLHLIAHGFRDSFEPWWMTRDLSVPIDEPVHEVTLATDAEIDELLQSQIPYVMPVQMESTRKLIRETDDVRWLVVRDDGAVVGQAIVNLTGTHAGLFNVGVDGRYRHKGLGRSLTNAAMIVAREAGATTTNLNSTPMGERMYARCGFNRSGTGMTWTIPATEIDRPVDPIRRDLILAFGRGDTSAVTRMDVLRADVYEVDPQAIAARFRHPEMLRHIIALGETPDIINLWNAGLRDEAVAAATNPEARERTYGARRARPIHLAVEQGAGTLVLALIRAGADLTARDAEFRATPLDWAHACNKPTIARIIRQAGGE